MATFLTQDYPLEIDHLIGDTTTACTWEQNLFFLALSSSDKNIFNYTLIWGVLPDVKDGPFKATSSTSPPHLTCLQLCVNKVHNKALP